MTGTGPIGGADIAVENAVRACLLASAPVLALCPAAHVIFRQGRKPSPCIIAGESQVVPIGRDSFGITRLEVFQTWHVWQEAVTLHGVKAIMAAMYEALRTGPIKVASGWGLAGFDITSSRGMYDPDGKTAHGVFSIAAQVSR